MQFWYTPSEELQVNSKVNAKWTGIRQVNFGIRQVRGFAATTEGKTPDIQTDGHIPHLVWASYAIRINQ